MKTGTFINALVDDETKPLFPPSKNRSARIRKKLIQRFGGEFEKKKVMVRLPMSVVTKLREEWKL